MLVKGPLVASMEMKQSRYGGIDKKQKRHNKATIFSFCSLNNIHGTDNRGVAHNQWPYKI